MGNTGLVRAQKTRLAAIFSMLDPHTHNGPCSPSQARV